MVCAVVLLLPGWCNGFSAQPVAVSTMWGFASKFGIQEKVSPYSVLLPELPPTDNKTVGNILDNVLYMMPAVWGRRLQTLYDLVKAIQDATVASGPGDPSLSRGDDNVDSLEAELRALPLPTLCGSRNEKSKASDTPGRLRAADVVRAVIGKQDTVRSQGRAELRLLASLTK